MKRKIIIAAAAIVAAAALLGVWCRWFSPTKVAFVNWQVSELGQIAKANDNTFLKISELPQIDLSEARRFDMVFINGMGLRITAEQREALRREAEKGLPVLVTAATNPDNGIVSVDSLAAESLKQYLSGGGRTNYRNMLRYVRRNVDGKTFRAPVPEAAEERTYYMIYHADTSVPDNEDLGFNSIAEYEEFLKREGLYETDAPKILLTGQMGEPSGLVAALEKAGNVVYPVRFARTFFGNGHADSVKFSAVINMAHGRMGDYVVDYLTKHNIPLFAPLNVNSLVEDWENDRMGMSGGFLSQSVVTPEIDGAIRPFVLFGNYVGDDGLQYLHAIPERLEHFVNAVGNYISLQRKPEREKKIAIYYFKGPGQSALAAGGMEVVPSLYNLLVRLRKEGYDVSGLPSSAAALGEMIQRYGSFPDPDRMTTDGFVRTAHPEIITPEQYSEWTSEFLAPELQKDAESVNGEFPGSYMATSDGNLAIPRLRFGNVVLLPQPAAGIGDDDFAIVHGTDAAPPYAYIASYLWAQFGFRADALIHFGAHGSLEFTPRKQVALSRLDWGDRLVGDLPHFYVYTIANVGEAMTAKRRSYAGLHSYLTPPFMESGVRTTYSGLTSRIEEYDRLLGSDKPDANALEKASIAVKETAMELGICSELGLDTIPGKAYSESEIAKLGNFAEELVSEKIAGALYVMGEPYEAKYIRSTVLAMSTDPVAYGLYAIDRAKDRAEAGMEDRKPEFSRKYRVPAKKIVEGILDGGNAPDDARICRMAGISSGELAKAREISAAASQRFMSAMFGGKNWTDEEKALASAVTEVETALKNVVGYRDALLASPEKELESIINGLSGGYVVPSPGGDPVANPNTLPTGRNLFAINAEATPSKTAWDKGRKLAENTISLYRERHNDSIPRKVSYTLWSSEFIETEGATIAQILYMLGVEPVWDVFGRVTDLRLIPSSELGRPRIDVVVQTSGQLRDLAASRLFLISRAVEMAAASQDDAYGNQVAAGVVEAERILVEKGVPPKNAREMSTYRVFGGVNGNYGTGIQGMVQAEDSWTDESEIAQVYLNNMGAYYGSEDKWEDMRQYAFEAALSGTDAVIQPRQSNTWGALSLDHVYEFMGGMNLAVRNVTGKDPDAYLSDYRNRNNVRMQEVKEAIGVESRTTIFNPNYIKEKMKGGAGDAAAIAEIVQNTYGWNVMKPQAIDERMWNSIYDVYVKDSYGLGVRQFFEDKNPAAMQEITSVMLETARKGLWKASETQIADISAMHADFENIGRTFMDETGADGGEKGVVMKKEELSGTALSRTNLLNNTIIAVFAVAAVVFMAIFIRKRRKAAEEEQ